MPAAITTYPNLYPASSRVADLKLDLADQADVVSDLHEEAAKLAGEIAVAERRLEYFKTELQQAEAYAKTHF